MRSGPADYELLETDGPAGTYDVTIYSVFARAELADSGLKQAEVAGGTVWLGEDPNSASIYFLSSGERGHRIAHRAATGPRASIATLEDLVQRFAPLVDEASP